MKYIRAFFAFINDILFPEPMTYEEWVEEVEMQMDYRFTPRLKDNLVPNTGEIIFKKMQEAQRDM